MAGIVLVKLPTAVPVTFTDNVQDPAAGIVYPADIETEVEPGTAVSTPAPPQVVPTPGAAAITKPPGRLSVNAEVIAVSAELVLVKVMVRSELVF